MLYFISSNEKPLKYVETGFMQSPVEFLHSRRNLDFFALLVGCKGKLYIAQDEYEHTLEPEHFLLLFPHHEHYGYQLCDPELSYYWCHFKVRDEEDACQLSETAYRETILQQWNNHQSKISKNIYLLPEHGHIFHNDRISLLFRQLIDLSTQNYYSPYILDYALSMLVMEITQNFMVESRLHTEISTTNYNIIEICEWLRINCDLDLTVKGVANKFGYNPNYLTTVFKRLTGLSLLKYINQERVSMAKRLLLDTSEPIKSIALMVGYKDDKHFMKVFKQFEGTTPGKFRNIYYRKRLNKD